ncbi:transcriptional repressor [Jannaschia sp.]|nr:transcriptional repressor [Jannaschia sp.]
MMTSIPDTGLGGFDAHDHADCIATAMRVAELRCAQDGLRFTPVRRTVLEILLREHRAMGAYSVLEELSARGFGSQPPVAYRALDFLVAQGFVHKVERLNAFIACAAPGDAHAPAFMICRVCETVAEASCAPMRSAFGHAAAERGFTIERTVIEAEGICPSCTGAAPE